MLGQEIPSRSSKGKGRTDRSCRYNRSEGFVEVAAIALGIATGNQPHFVLDDIAMLITFYLEDPLDLYSLITLRHVRDIDHTSSLSFAQ